MRYDKIYTVTEFQSTHSLRSATVGTEIPPYAGKVSIHALLAECDFRNGRFTTATRSFNPRTPCGVRQKFMGDGAVDRLFQSTHSLRSATGNAHCFGNERQVSIHALLAECDHYKPGTAVLVRGFNPRTPCGVRPGMSGLSVPLCRFQSTHSLRSATRRKNVCGKDPDVSIHALLAECDNVAARQVVRASSFNPRTPCGVRQPHI